jgi:hypothetical protein
MQGKQNCHFLLQAVYMSQASYKFFRFLWLRGLPLYLAASCKPKAFYLPQAGKLFTCRWQASFLLPGNSILPFSFTAPLEPACLEDEIIILQYEAGRPRVACIRPNIEFVLFSFAAMTVYLAIHFVLFS